MSESASNQGDLQALFAAEEVVGEARAVFGFVEDLDSAVDFVDDGCF